MAKKLSYKYVCEYFKKYGYIVNDIEYKDSATPINVTCPKGHIWKVTFGHFKGNNIKLIRIPYWEFKNIEIILNEIYE